MGAEGGCGQFVKGLEVRSASFVAQHQPAEVTEPTECAFDDVASCAQVTAMRLSFAERGQDRCKSKPFDQCRQSDRTISRVALQGFGVGAWSALWPGDGRHMDQGRQRNLVIARIGRRCCYRHRNAPRVGQHMTLTSSFRSVRRVTHRLC